MKIEAKYPTKEHKWHTENTYSNVSSGWVQLDVVRIIRTPCGSGVAAKRYYYHADCIAPKDAEYAREGLIRVHINRPFNRHFKPKNFEFVDNICELNKP